MSWKESYEAKRDELATADTLRDTRGYDQWFEFGWLAAQRWIPVEERLPEKSVLVLCIDNLGYALGLRNSIDGHWIDEAYGDDLNGVTHWMPLPELPR